MSAFTIERGLVVMDTISGPISLHPDSVEQLLDIFQRENAAAAFNELFDAHRKSGAIPMVSPNKATA